MMNNIHNVYKSFENNLSYQEKAQENDENCFRKFFNSYLYTYYNTTIFNRDNSFFFSLTSLITVD